MSSVVMGYQLVGYGCLEALLEMNEKILAVVTHPDDPSEEQWFPSVAELARKNHIPVYMPEKVNDPSFVSLLTALEPDFLFSFYYRKILNPDILKIPKRGAFNMHGSLLPKFRGRACINWAILMGETKTGATLHVMEEKADTGDIVGQKDVMIEFADTALVVTQKVADAAHALLLDVVPLLRNGRVLHVPQNHADATYFGGRKPEDGRINWDEPAIKIYNLMRAVTHPFPGAFTFFNDKKLFVWWGKPDDDALVPPDTPMGRIFHHDKEKGLAVRTGKGVFYMQSLQLEGDDEMKASDFYNAHPLILAYRFYVQSGSYYLDDVPPVIKAKAANELEKAKFPVMGKNILKKE